MTANEYEMVDARGNRWSITSSRGRFVGRLPGDIDESRGPEGLVIRELALWVDGLIEVCCGGPRADVATCSSVFEVEPVRSWRRGMAQAAAYAWLTGLAPHLALFGDISANGLEMVRREMPTDMGLWIHDHNWRTVTRNWHRNVRFRGFANLSEFRVITSTGTG